MPHLEVKPSGKMEFVSKQKKSKPDQKPKPDLRDQRMADLQSRVEELEIQKTQLVGQNHNLQLMKRQAIDEAKAFKQAAIKYKEECEELNNKYDSLDERLARRADEGRQKEKIIRQKDSEIRAKDKETEECRIEMKVQKGAIKQEQDRNGALQDRNAALQDKLTTVLDEKRRLERDVAMRRVNEEKLLADNKVLREGKADLLDLLTRERELALDREARFPRAIPVRRRPEDDYYR